MIISFRHPGLEALLRRGETKGMPDDHARGVRALLIDLDGVATPEELRALGHEPHRVPGHLSGYFAVRGSDGWRVVFRCNGRGIGDVDYARD